MFSTFKKIKMNVFTSMPLIVRLFVKIIEGAVVDSSKHKDSVRLTATGLRQPTSMQYLILSSTSAAATALRSSSSRDILFLLISSISPSNWAWASRFPTPSITVLQRRTETTKVGLYMDMGVNGFPRVPWIPTAMALRLLLGMGIE